MTARALTPDERKEWRRMRDEGYRTEACYSPVMSTGIAWRWNNLVLEGPKFQTRQAAIRDAIKKEKKG